MWEAGCESLPRPTWVEGGGWWGGQAPSSPSSGARSDAAHGGVMELRQGFWLGPKQSRGFGAGSGTTQGLLRGI